ncbi:MAG: hypothetical protein L3J36_16425 [Rhodobacteraceae bacterium]|nr:hypothetical protein [Paracoccaceae bacterium]
MLVTDIQIAQYHYCTGSSRHIANVSMTLKHQIVTLFCRLDLPEDESANDRATAFVSEATRQLLRMPEYRSGQQTLAFSDTLGGISARLSA